MIAAMSTRPNRQNRSTCSRMSVLIALTPPCLCEPVHMRCAPMRSHRAPTSLTKPSKATVIFAAAELFERSKPEQKRQLPFGTKPLPSG
jgi:hypothetical protein